MSKKRNMNNTENFEEQNDYFEENNNNDLPTESTEVKEEKEDIPSQNIDKENISEVKKEQEKIAVQPEITKPKETKTADNKLVSSIVEDMMREQKEKDFEAFLNKYPQSPNFKLYEMDKNDLINEFGIEYVSSSKTKFTTAFCVPFYKNLFAGITTSFHKKKFLEQKQWETAEICKQNYLKAKEMWLEGKTPDQIADAFIPGIKCEEFDLGNY